MQTVMNLINLDYLKLMTDGDRDMEQTMLEMLLDELPSEVEKIKTCFAETNWQDLSKVSHKLKSTLAFIGNDNLTAANKTIELLTKNDRIPNETEIVEIENQINLADQIVPGVIQELKQIFSQY